MELVSWGGGVLGGQAGGFTNTTCVAAAESSRGFIISSLRPRVRVAQRGSDGAAERSSSFWKRRQKQDAFIRMSLLLCNTPQNPHPEEHLHCFLQRNNPQLPQKKSLIFPAVTPAQIERYKEQAPHTSSQQQRQFSCELGPGRGVRTSDRSVASSLNFNQSFGIVTAFPNADSRPPPPEHVRQAKTPRSQLATRSSAHSQR